MEQGMTILPERLKQGDVIGVVSPSSPVTPALGDQFARGVAFLEKLGLRVVVGEHVHGASLGYAAAPQEKAADINRMFADASVRAIICSQGGATANACLPYLDWEVIRSHPKIFLGISDISVLLNAIYARTGLVTFHGNDVMWGFGRNPTAYDEQEFVRCLFEAGTGAIPPRAPRRTIRAGAAQGTLLGGNLPCLMKLAGTPYFPDFTDTILFVEAIDITPEACDHYFQQLRQMGVFDRLRGALVGYIDGLQTNPHAAAQMEDVLLQVSAGYDFPILKLDEFGHNCPNTVLPVGGTVRMDTAAGSVEITGRCLV
jgi:muramoyltetrapeptide carboxypeptidase